VAWFREGVWQSLGGVWNSVKSLGGQIAEGSKDVWADLFTNERKEKWILDYDKYKQGIKVVEDRFSTPEQKQAAWQKMVNDKTLDINLYNKYNKEQADYYNSLQAKPENKNMKYDFDKSREEFENSVANIASDLYKNWSQFDRDRITATLNKLQKEYASVEGYIRSVEEQKWWADQDLHNNFNTWKKDMLSFYKDYIGFLKQWKSDEEAYKTSVELDKTRAERVSNLQWTIQTDSYIRAIENDWNDPDKHWGNKLINTGLNVWAGILSIAGRAISELVNQPLLWMYEGIEELRVLWVSKETDSWLSKTWTKFKYAFYQGLDALPSLAPEIAATIATSWSSMVTKLDKINKVSNLLQKTGMSAKWANRITNFVTETTKDMLLFDAISQRWAGGVAKDDTWVENLMFNVPFNSFMAYFFHWQKQIIQQMSDEFLKTPYVSKETLSMIGKEDADTIKKSLIMDYSEYAKREKDFYNWKISKEERQAWLDWRVKWDWDRMANTVNVFWGEAESFFSALNTLAEEKALLNARKASKEVVADWKTIREWVDSWSLYKLGNERKQYLEAARQQIDNILWSTKQFEIDAKTKPQTQAYILSESLRDLISEAPNKEELKTALYNKLWANSPEQWVMSYILWDQVDDIAKLQGYDPKKMANMMRSFIDNDLPKMTNLNVDGITYGYMKTEWGKLRPYTSMVWPESKTSLSRVNTFVQDSTIINGVKNWWTLNNNQKFDLLQQMGMLPNPRASGNDITNSMRNKLLKDMGITIKVDNALWVKNARVTATPEAMQNFIDSMRRLQEGWFKLSNAKPEDMKAYMLTFLDDVKRYTSYWKANGMNEVEPYLESAFKLFQAQKLGTPILSQEYEEMFDLISDAIKQWDYKSAERKALNYILDTKLKWARDVQQLKRDFQNMKNSPLSNPMLAKSVADKLITPKRDQELLDFFNKNTLDTTRPQSMLAPKEVGVPWGYGEEYWKLRKFENQTTVEATANAIESLPDAMPVPIANNLKLAEDIFNIIQNLEEVTIKKNKGKEFFSETEWKSIKNQGKEYTNKLANIINNKYILEAIIDNKKLSEQAKRISVDVYYQKNGDRLLNNYESIVKHLFWDDSKAIAWAVSKTWDKSLWQMTEAEIREIAEAYISQSMLWMKKQGYPRVSVMRDATDQLSTILSYIKQYHPDMKVGVARIFWYLPTSNTILLWTSLKEWDAILDWRNSLRDIVRHEATHADLSKKSWRSISNYFSELKKLISDLTHKNDKAFVSYAASKDRVNNIAKQAKALSNPDEYIDILYDIYSKGEISEQTFDQFRKLKANETIEELVVEMAVGDPSTEALKKAFEAQGITKDPTKVLTNIKNNLDKIISQRQRLAEAAEVLFYKKNLSNTALSEDVFKNTLRRTLAEWADIDYAKHILDQETRKASKLTKASELESFNPNKVFPDEEELADDLDVNDILGEKVKENMPEDIPGMQDKVDNLIHLIEWKSDTGLTKSLKYNKEEASKEKNWLLSKTLKSLFPDIWEREISLAKAWDLFQFNLSGKYREIFYKLWWLDNKKVKVKDLLADEGVLKRYDDYKAEFEKNIKWLEESEWLSYKDLFLQWKIQEPLLTREQFVLNEVINRILQRDSKLSKEAIERINKDITMDSIVRLKEAFRKDKFSTAYLYNKVKAMFEQYGFNLDSWFSLVKEGAIDKMLHEINDNLPEAMEQYIHYTYVDPNFDLRAAAENQMWAILERALHPFDPKNVNIKLPDWEFADDFIDLMASIPYELGPSIADDLVEQAIKRDRLQYFIPEPVDVRKSLDYVHYNKQLLWSTLSKEEVESVIKHIDETKSAKKAKWELTNEDILATNTAKENLKSTWAVRAGGNTPQSTLDIYKEYGFHVKIGDTPRANVRIKNAKGWWNSVYDNKIANVLSDVINNMSPVEFTFKGSKWVDQTIEFPFARFWESPLGRQIDIDTQRLASKLWGSDAAIRWKDIKQLDKKTTSWSDAFWVIDAVFTREIDRLSRILNNKQASNRGNAEIGDAWEKIKKYREAQRKITEAYEKNVLDITPNRKESWLNKFNDVSQIKWDKDIKLAGKKLSDKGYSVKQLDVTFDVFRKTEDLGFIEAAAKQGEDISKDPAKLYDYEPIQSSIPYTVKPDVVAEDEIEALAKWIDEFGSSKINKEGVIVTLSKEWEPDYYIKGTILSDWSIYATSIEKNVLSEEDQLIQKKLSEPFNDTPRSNFNEYDRVASEHTDANLNSIKKTLEDRAKYKEKMDNIINAKKRRAWKDLKEAGQETAQEYKDLHNKGKRRLQELRDNNDGQRILDVINETKEANKAAASAPKEFSVDEAIKGLMDNINSSYDTAFKTETKRLKSYTTLTRWDLAHSDERLVLRSGWGQYTLPSIKQMLWQNENFVSQHWQKAANVQNSFLKMKDDFEPSDLEFFLSVMGKGYSKLDWEKKALSYFTEWMDTLIPRYIKDTSNVMDFLHNLDELHTALRESWYSDSVLYWYRNPRAIEKMTEDMMWSLKWELQSWAESLTQNQIRDALTRAAQEQLWYSEKKAARFVRDIYSDWLGVGVLQRIVGTLRWLYRILKYSPLSMQSGGLLFLNNTIVWAGLYLSKRRWLEQIINHDIIDKIMSMGILKSENIDWHIIQTLKDSGEFNGNLIDLLSKWFDILPLLSEKQKAISKSIFLWWVHTAFDLIAAHSVNRLSIAQAIAKSGIPLDQLDNMVKELAENGMSKHSEFWNWLVWDAIGFRRDFMTNSRQSLLGRNRFSNWILFTNMQSYSVARMDELIAATRRFRDDRGVKFKNLWEFADYINNDNLELKWILNNALLSAKLWYYIDRVTGGDEDNNERRMWYIKGLNEYLSAWEVAFFNQLLFAPFGAAQDYIKYGNITGKPMNLVDGIEVATYETLQKAMTMLMREGKILDLAINPIVAYGKTWDWDFTKDVLTDTLTKISEWLGRFNALPWMETFGLKRIEERSDPIWQLLLNLNETNKSLSDVNDLMNVQTIDNLINGNDNPIVKALTYMPVIGQPLKAAMGKWGFGFNEVVLNKMRRMVKEDPALTKIWNWEFPMEMLEDPAITNRLYQELAAQDYTKLQYKWEWLHENKYGLNNMKDYVFTKNMVDKVFGGNLDRFEQVINQFQKGNDKWLVKLLAMAEGNEPWSTKAILWYMANRMQKDIINEYSGGRYISYKDIPVEVQSEIQKIVVGQLYPYLNIADATSWYKLAQERFEQLEPNIMKWIAGDTKLNKFVNGLSYIDMMTERLADSGDVNASKLKNVYAMVGKYASDPDTRTRLVEYAMNSIQDSKLSMSEKIATRMWVLLGNMDFYSELKKDPVLQANYWDELKSFERFVWWVNADINRYWSELMQGDMSPKGEKQYQGVKGYNYNKSRYNPDYDKNHKGNQEAKQQFIEKSKAFSPLEWFQWNRISSYPSVRYSPQVLASKPYDAYRVYKEWASGWESAKLTGDNPRKYPGQILANLKYTEAGYTAGRIKAKQNKLKRTRTKILSNGVRKDLPWG